MDMLYVDTSGKTETQFETRSYLSAKRNGQHEPKLKTLIQVAVPYPSGATSSLWASIVKEVMRLCRSSRVQKKLLKYIQSETGYSTV